MMYCVDEGVGKKTFISYGIGGIRSLEGDL